MSRLNPWSLPSASSSRRKYSADWPVDVSPGRRRYVGGFLLVNGVLITLLWLQVIVSPLLAGRLYPAGLAHLTTMIVQGFDLALLLPASFVAGVAYLRRRPPGGLLAPVYAVFLVLQMLALLGHYLPTLAPGGRIWVESQIGAGRSSPLPCP